MKLIEPIVAEAEAMAGLRRDLHAHPEIGFEEHRTSELVAATLEGWGIEVVRGLAGTGLVGIVRGARGPGPGIGLRADIDGLAMTEHNRFAHASRHPGRMHACGHDGHVAMLLAAARHLQQSRDFAGTVFLVFQPAEEGGGGAREMIRDGLFARFEMEAVFGMHNWPDIPFAVVAVRAGPVMASSSTFVVRLEGRGAHGAMPHNGIDPIPPACQMVQAFQTIITRNIAPVEPAVISVTGITAGEAINVVPETCEVRGTVRCFAAGTLDTIEERMREIVRHCAGAFAAGVELEFRRGYPPTVNHPRETELLRRTVRDFAGEEGLMEFEPTMGAEDFSYYLREKPGAFFFIGNGDGAHRAAGAAAGPCKLHNPAYDFNDALIPIGASLWVRLVESFSAAPG